MPFHRISLCTSFAECFDTHKHTLFRSVCVPNYEAIYLFPVTKAFRCDVTNSNCIAVLQTMLAMQKWENMFCLDTTWQQQQQLQLSPSTWREFKSNAIWCDLISLLYQVNHIFIFFMQFASITYTHTLLSASEWGRKEKAIWMSLSALSTVISNSQWQTTKPLWTL